MGIFHRTVRLSSLDGERSIELDALVDTGSSYTMVPGNLLRKLGISPVRKVPLELADGRRVEYDLGRALATVGGCTETTLVLFGEDNADPLLGAYTLEGLSLAVDPVHGRLVPAIAKA